jgi:hypothetical protein
VLATQRDFTVLAADVVSGVQNVLMSQRDNESVDWLDLGPDPDEGKPPKSPRRHYLWYGAIAAVVVLALLLTRAQQGTNRSAASSGSPSRTASASPTPSSRPSPVQATSSGSFVDPGTLLLPSPNGSPVQVRTVGHPLLKVPADWELFAYAAGVVIRIQLAQGRVTSTTVPQPGSDTPVVFVVGTDRAMVRPQDDTPSVVVRDGKPATELPASLRQGMSLLPGPDQQHLWAEAGSALALFTLDGHPSGPTIDIPSGGSLMGSDGAGYALLSGVGGFYSARPGAVHRVTSGLLLASGPTRWLTEECDDSLSCATVITDRVSGARHHTVNTPPDMFQPGLGSISPDGRTAALPRSGGGVADDAVDLVDLGSGTQHSVEVGRTTASQSGPSFVWSPDSRWLFATDSAGQILSIDRSTGRATPLGVRLPPVTQLALRHRSG